MLILSNFHRVPRLPLSKNERLKHTIFTNYFKNKTVNIYETIQKEIEAKAQAQFPLGSDMEKQVIVAKFFNPTGARTWYLMNQGPNDPDYLWGVVDLFEVEVGSFSKSELEYFRGPYGLGIERDLNFKEVNAIILKK